MTRITEMTYKGNIGIHELMIFYKMATPEQKSQLDQLLQADQKAKAWQLLQDVVGVELLERKQ